MLRLVELPAGPGSVFLNPKFVVGVTSLVEPNRQMPLVGKCLVIQATGAMAVDLSPTKAVERLTAGEFETDDDDD